MTDTRIRELIANHLGHDLDRVQADDHLIDDLGGDSLDTIEIVMDLEDEYDIEITDDEQETLGTVGDIQALVAAKVTAKR